MVMVCDVGGEKEHRAGGNALSGHGVRQFSLPVGGNERKMLWA